MIISHKTGLILLSLVLFITLAGCTGNRTENDQAEAKNQETMTISSESFGRIGDSEVSLFTLRNGNGMEAKITNYGGIVISLTVPDANGEPVDVVLGFDSLQPYLDGHPYFGAIVGRYANRIANGEFVLEGKPYKLARNNGNNHLHGGLEGFDKKVWEARTIQRPSETGVELRCLSRDGEEGYPGSLKVFVTYALTDRNELKIDYLAYSDAVTVVNLTHHGYFNLHGQGNGDILDHELMILADRYTPVNEQLIPTGDLEEVAGGPMDFRTSKKVGRDFAQVPGGFDHNFVLNKRDSATVAARLHSPETGIVMEVFTDQPGIQFYSGNFLDGSLTGKNGKKYEQHFALCLETQHFPDSPNQPGFPLTILRPDEKFESQTVYRFSVNK